MNEIQIRNLDLNLLVVFRVLMEEGSVNRAAEQLGRTPSAVSHALGRLRDQLGDPLLVRVGGRMQPSPKAQRLYAEIKPILLKIERAVQPDHAFDPASSARIFRIAGPTLTCISTEIIARMHEVAPGTGLQLLPQTPQTAQELIEENLDIAWGNANFPVPDGLTAEPIRPLKRYVLGRRGHPATNDWSQEAWLNWPHVVVRIPGATHGTVQEHFDGLGLTRRIGLHLASWAGIGPALDRTNMLSNHVAMVIEECPGAADLQLFEPPVPMPDLTFRVMWSTRLDSDPAIVWLRGIVLQAFDAVLARADERIRAGTVIRARDRRDPPAHARSDAPG